MKIVQSLLTELRFLGIKLWIEGDHLHYKAPEGVPTSTLLEQLRDKKAEIFAFLQSLQVDAPIAAVPEIKPRSRQEVCPLSFAQQRLWFLDHLDGQSATYNISRAMQLSGPLDVEALEQGIKEIIRRHEVLRTTFQIIEGQPVQVIAPTVDFSLTIVDLQSWPEENRTAEITCLTHDAVHAPFDLSRDTLIRSQLLKLGADSHVLLVTMHHIVR